jgi:hypothetical protein
MQPAFVSAAKIAATLTPALRATDGVITITDIGDHLRPEWPITITGMRTSRRNPRFARKGAERDFINIELPVVPVLRWQAVCGPYGPY